MAKENKPESGVDVDQQKRRKIVKGIAGLPALVTLASGSAVATSSTQCFDKTPPKDVAGGKCIVDDPIGRIKEFQDGVFYDSQDGEPAAARLYDSASETYCLVNEKGEMVEPSSGDLFTVSCYTSFITPPP